MLGQDKCQNVSHNDMEIQGVCNNKLFKQPSRRICYQCIKDHQNNDQNFDHSDIKSEQEIQQMINEFKYYKVDRMNNIALQCWIQQYLLNIELIEYVKLWNYKYNKIHEILEQLNQFDNNQWKQISFENYLNNEKNISIVEYLQQFQQKLLYIDDLKDIYIKDIIKEQKYNEIYVNTEQNKLSMDVVQTVDKYKNQLIQYITQNDVFKQKHEQNEEFIITICELMLKQGYDLKTDALNDKFKVLQDILLDVQIEKYKSLYLQSYNIALKQQADESEKGFGLSLINQSLHIKGKYAKSLNIKGLLYQNDNKFEQSIEMFDEAIKIDPKFANAYYNKGCSLKNLQNNEYAIEMFDQAIKIEPKQIQAYDSKGNSLQNIKKYEQAIEMYDQAIKIDPKFIQAYINKGCQLNNLQKYEEAIEIFDQAIKIDHKYVDAYMNKGNSLSSQQKYEQAIEIFDQAIKIDPMYVSAYNNKGCQLKNLQKYEQAIEMFDQAIKIDPQSVVAYMNKGYSLNKLKLHEQSMDIFKQVLQLNPNN